MNKIRTIDPNGKAMRVVKAISLTFFERRKKVRVIVSISVKILLLNNKKKKIVGTVQVR